MAPYTREAIAADRQQIDETLETLERGLRNVAWSNPMFVVVFERLADDVRQVRALVRERYGMFEQLAVLHADVLQGRLAPRQEETVLH